MSLVFNKSALLKGLRWGRPYALRLSSRQTESQVSQVIERDKESDISLKNDEKNELETVIKQGMNGRYMDRVWETNTAYRQDKSYNQITDPYFIAHKPLELFIEATAYHDWGLNIAGIKKRLKNWISYRESNQQKYYPRRHANLGPELSVANFVVVRGGKVKFEHDPDVWATRLDHFPSKYHPRYRVMEVDASHLKLKDEGIDNFQEVYSLRTLNLSANLLDDWSCDKMGRMFRNSNLESLDISNNPLISHRGIETLHRIRSLRELKIRGTSAASYPFLELLILSFNDLVPDCRIIY